MSFDPRDVHVILNGYDGTIMQYRINMELLRYNFSFGKDLWITTTYNCNPDLLPSGLGENTFMLIPGSRGFCYGHIDELNEGLSFAANAHREIICCYNFDVLWFSEEGFKKAVSDFVDSGKMISSAIDTNGLIATDCIFFRRDFLKDMLPLGEKYAKYRGGLEIAERYKNTTLGFDNVEEFLWKTLIETVQKQGIYYNEEENIRTAEESDEYVRKFFLDNIWHKMDRTDLPRLRYSEQLGMGHIHEKEFIKEKLEEFNITNGLMVKALREGKI